MSVLDEVLEQWLPVRSARWVAAVTVPIILASFGLPEFLERFDIAFTREGKLFVRIVAPLTASLIGALILLVLVLRHLHTQAPFDPKGLNSNEIILNRAEPLSSILASIAKYHSQEIPATPRRIASDLEMNPEIVLAFMWKYHNEQFVTFRNGGNRPELDTPFILSPKAWDAIKIIEA